MSIFAETKIVEEIRTERIPLLSEDYVDLSAVADGYIEEMVLAAEAEVERRLTVPLSPVEVFPHPPSEDEIDDLNGVRWVQEPGYDLPPGYFSPGHWGLLRLRIRPVISVSSVALIHPVSHTTVYDVPDSWIMLDQTGGTITILPSTDVANGRMSMFLLQAMSSGYEIPHIIRVRYKAGLSDIHTRYPDIPAFIKQLAMVRIIDSGMVPQSGSLSADGISQSFSLDSGKMVDVINKRLDDLRDQIVGPRMVFA